MGPAPTIQLIAIIVLIIFSGFFSATETAYTGLNKVRLKSLFTNGNKTAGKVLKLSEDYDKLLSTILIGNNIVNLSLASIATVFFMTVLPEGVNYALISTVIITVAVLIFGEITPKFIAKNAPEKMAALTYPLIVFFTYLFIPVTFLFSLYKKLIAKIFKMKDGDVITQDEIITYVEEAEEDGTFKEDETELIRSAIEFDDVEVGDILIPRVNMTAVDCASSLEDIKNVFETEGYSRLPVYKDSVDTVIGILHEKDFFTACIGGNQSLKSILQPVVYTTEHIKISQLLRQLQKKKSHMAIVVDEYGGTLGLVTMEDVIEELVGEIWDEHDEEVNYFKKIAEDTYIVDGRAPLEDMFEFFDVEADDAEASTVSGWVIEKLGEIPRIGKRFEYLNLKISVAKSTVKKVLEVKIQVLKETEE